MVEAAATEIRLLTNALYANRFRRLWILGGPNNSNLHMFTRDGHVALIQEFTDGGFDYYLPGDALTTLGALTEIMERCKPMTDEEVNEDNI
jgi:hypothetical protein